jgi:REP element-mobilizing transposase RayT
MPRYRSKSGIYHIIMRGINRQSIFEDEEDFIKFIQTIQKYKDVCGYKLYAYCLMGNHVHMLLMEGKEPLEQIMRRVCGSYVLWYNRKYGRIGYLFQDRYKSEPVEDDKYFLTVLRYIYQNPLKAGFTASIEEYAWSNYKEYIEGSKNTDTFVLDAFGTDRGKAVRSFIEYINEPNEDVCLEISEKRQATDEEARAVIMDLCKVNNAADLQKLDIYTRNRCLKDLKEGCGLSIRQLERLTGINRGVIQRA